MKMHALISTSALAILLTLASLPLDAQPDGILKGTIRKIDPAGPSVTLPVDGKDREFAVREETRVFGYEKLPLADRLKSFKIGDEVYFKPAVRDGKDVLVGLKRVDDKNPPPAFKGKPFDASGLKPLPALDKEKYQGFSGGLYPQGNQRPDAHEKIGLERARRIVPLDAAGKADPDGKIVLLSIGMSNTSQASEAFTRALKAEAERNPRLVFVNGAQGGMTAARIMNPDEPRSGAVYWSTVNERLKAAGVTPAQVQAVWIKEADAGPTQGFPQYAKTLQSELAAIVRVLPKRFPNVQNAYLSSRIYAGFAKSGLNPEPYAFESGFSVKWLIEDQIKEEPSLALDKAPWLSWGPYLWDPAFRETDFAADGTHHSTAGSDKIAREMMTFFKTDATTRGWFLRAAPTGKGQVQNKSALAGDDVDALFKQKVLDAIKQRISIEKIEAFVGKKAVVNTSIEGHRDILEIGTISIDPKESDVKRLVDAKDVVYWVQTARRQFRPIVVGVVWTDKNEMKIFGGEVFPP